MAAVPAVVATVISLWIGEWMVEKRNEYTARMEVLKDIMAYAGERTHPKYLEAINSVRVVFYDDKGTMENWKDLVDYMNTMSREDYSDEAKREVWQSKLADLTVAMGESLGIGLERENVFRSFVAPETIEKYE